jgi:hypothetical protein
MNVPAALDPLDCPDAGYYKVSTNIKTTRLNAPVNLDPLDPPDAGYYKVSTNIKIMAINIPVALSPLDRDVEPEPPHPQPRVAIPTLILGLSWP